MFTGLIQAVGSVKRHSSQLVVRGCDPFSPLSLGDSIAVDGVCLTVEKVLSDGFLADVSEETLSRTTLGSKADRGGIVNLEPALRFSDRLGGHLVSGHVDGLGEIASIQQLPQSWSLEVLWKDQVFGRYICEKASICLNGISLTVAGCTEIGDRFWISVIPHTWRNTSLYDLQTRDLVNLEADLFMKYTESLLLGKSSSLKKSPNISDELTKEWLASNGWE